MTAETKPIVTRFAPSPTGYLHIGGARTALFNWLMARGKSAPAGSQFLLRIEDTDRARHNEEAVEAILDGLRWMGLDWDGEPLSQHARADRHAEVADELLANGKAFKCWLQGDELDAARNEAREKNIRFTSPYRDGGEGEGSFVIRLKAPIEGETVVKDAVQGEVRFPNSVSDDTVILRSDGTPTYMLAVVVDDHDMGVTHVIRGDDHLNNTPKQQHIYEAMGWDLPVFAHVPLIHGEDGKKLSKRHGALGVEAYRDQGFLPDGLLNGLLKLGWSHGDEEIIPRDKALEWFGLSGIGKAPARLDLEKMAAINGHFVRELSDKDFAEKAIAFLPDDQSADVAERIERAAPFLKERVKTFSDAESACGFLTLTLPFEITGKAAKPLKKEGATDTLAALAAALEGVEDWSAATLELAIQTYAETNGLGFGQVGPPLRAALTAGNPAPTLGETLFALGREEAMARIEAAQALVKAQ
ncbi:glutamate--tRNA ligase [Parvularcula sp. ZS-1/3]|uniref:Glutamate--tRNA ligase n=1 Tax=Parvularcula mediterranea TaxID=2732508 RepID=A0A7Y3RND5_9PROT|nr:glutamate--tRNA ligase [Parvularcula mediterranea]NNU17170.1 glutamate--tRNA ligase [Parvularcula mediterranea]